MQQLIFATNNAHKIEEINSIVKDLFVIVSLEQAGITIDIPEPYDTLAENAFTKCATIFQLTGQDCFGEDTGLEVNALNGEPGVKSARYAGDEKNPQANMEKLLMNLQTKSNTSACFRTVIALLLKGEKYFFEGVCTGKIIDAPRGDKGFGYDPIFVPDGDTKTFAEMSIEEKNRYSHRKKATQQLIEFLQAYGKN